MRQFWMSLILALLVLAGLWALLNRKEINNISDAVDLARKHVTDFSSQSPFLSASSEKTLTGSGTIRVATFNIHRLGREKFENRRTAELLARTFREFDVIALQGLETGDELQLRRLIDLVNSEGGHYDFVVSPISPGDRLSIYAFVMNLETVQLDGGHRYMMQDPDNLLTHPPFIGWFRTVTSNPVNSFTFNLVNVCFDEKKTGELERIQDIFRAVRNDGRGEDDIIVAGDFHTSHKGLDALRQEIGLLPAIQGQTTAIRANTERDNILIDMRATTEFSGRSGVFDFMNVFNLKTRDAVAISEQMPCWAEFSRVEGTAGYPMKSARTPQVSENIK